VPVAVKLIEPFSMWIVAAVVFGRPLTEPAISNQSVSPAGIAVPLKFPVILETVEGTRRSSRFSTTGQKRVGLAMRRTFRFGAVCANHVDRRCQGYM
jgi:hypothetical protein